MADRFYREIESELDNDAARIGQLARLQRLIERIRSDDPDLTNRQTAILMTSCLVEGRHTVASLATYLGVSKPVITRALNTLGGLGLMRRIRDESDRRVVFAVATAAGRDLVGRLA